MNPIRKTLECSQIKISYLEWNPPQTSENTQPLLLLHGLADHALVWTNLGNFLADNYHIVAPDMRGHGNSSKPNTGYSFSEAIADLEALMQHLNWSNAHILGHSWTGKLLPIWAKQNPKYFRSMILVDPIFITKMPAIFKLSLPIVYRKLDCLKGMGPFSSYKDAEEQASQLSQYAGWSSLQQQVFQEGIEQKPDGKWGSKFIIPARNQIFSDVMKVAGLTKKIDIPTLFIQPERGVNRMDWQLKPYQKYLTNLNIKQVPGNHWPFLVESDMFNQTVAEFLATN
ncbi:alpha/beta hydrolase fold family protein [Lyngbya aestuarii BL J]|uniref:Alpha/beta hydrolase fold family protein n=1 Tax=Lyngbya aestuarii BL J TaxID=1348334 RepID=U7QEU7_9CYAN|nr:alpha/beta hydrolase [Lyngbya aestuarii]ERT06464.1 alpha/beta hydrolase fold family protein [Lyngbya aestuarii BL J]